ncbi:MAG: arginine--tRNA ligase [Lachnospiraceae bacterium]|nr:arginine--tRNA ligase [Lachnospiraceae bacterium]
MKEKICDYLSGIVEGVSADEFLDMAETPPEEEMGDLALPCFGLAKKMHRNPKIIAAEIAERLNAQKENIGLERVEQVGAYCNLFWNRKAYVENCVKKLQTENLGVARTGMGQTICMDYSSPNIAKNFHVGHLRTTIIGNALYKIYQKLGFQVVRINHLGDWGTQFGKLIVAYKLWSSEELVKEKGIEELLRIYVKFNAEAEHDAQLITEAREWFVKMEQNDPEAIAIWEWFKQISMVEFERIYQLLGITFDSYVGESFYRGKVPALVEALKEKNLLVESQGAQVIDLEEYQMPPCLITKSDGSSIYHSRDIAAVLYRKEKYDFVKCIYVTGLEQSLHFKQVFKAIEVMGYDWAETLVHVPYGLVSLDGEKLSTRNGNIIYAEDILKEAIGRAEKAILEKNPNLGNRQLQSSPQDCLSTDSREQVARMVGVGAVIFHDLYNQRIKNIDFSWKEVLNFDGSTGPYVQYTYARAKSVLSKYGEPVDFTRTDWNALTDSVAYNLVKILGGYEDAVKNAAAKYEPSVVARYVMSLAAAFNKFYHDCAILKAEETVKRARLALTELTQRVLRDGCGLLGLECPEEM